jgi:DNA (cytosine-5)-methyltransferase 1
MKILNLYSGLGGNRLLWGDEHEITSIEICPQIGDVYQKLFPNDELIIGDACKYLEENFDRFDFIWSSPPCPTHGQYRHNVGVLGKGYKPVMPDMTLYGQIVFLQTYFKGSYVVENVKPYYTPLIDPSFILQRHLFWSNFEVSEKTFEPSKIRSKNKIEDFAGHEIVSASRIKDKRQALRNRVDSELGLHIFNHLPTIRN